MQSVRVLLKSLNKRIWMEAILEKQKETVNNFITTFKTHFAEKKNKAAWGRPLKLKNFIL